MPKSRLSWVRFQHPPTQWNLRGGSWNSVEYSTYIKKIQKIPPVKGTHARELLVFEHLPSWYHIQTMVLNNKIFSNHHVNLAITPHCLCMRRVRLSNVAIADCLINRKKPDIRYRNKILFMLSTDKNCSYILLFLAVWAPLLSLPRLRRQFQSSKGMAGKKCKKIGGKRRKMAGNVKAGILNIAEVL
jgi:hypothetical protein